MRTVVDVLDALERVGSRLEKERILSENAGNDLLRRSFIATFDPYVDYGVRKFKMPEPSKSKSDDRHLSKFIDVLLSSLATRELAGNAARDSVISHMKEMDAAHQKWCMRILLKNLRCGVQATTINKVWEGSIKKFSVQLSNKIDTEFKSRGTFTITSDITYPIIVEPKFDGLRLIAVKNDAGVVNLFTRNGTAVDTLPEIKKFLQDHMPAGMVFDGEGMSSTGDWNSTASIMMSGKNKKDATKFLYFVFDCLTYDEWSSQRTKMPYSKRRTTLLTLLKQFDSTGRSPLRAVEGSLVSDEVELRSMYAECLNGGYEGVMVKDPNASYSFKRSDAVRKLKPIMTVEGAIVGWYEGRENTRLEGKFGGFNVLLPNGVITNVAGGFSDALREEIMDNDPSTYIGRIVEAEAQPDPTTNDGLTVDGRMRFPVFCRFRDENDVDQSIMEAFVKHVEGRSVA